MTSEMAKLPQNILSCRCPALALGETRFRKYPNGGVGFLAGSIFPARYEASTANTIFSRRRSDPIALSPQCRPMSSKKANIPSFR